MLRCAIVGVGRWGQRLVDACQQQGQALSERIRFTHAVARSPEKYTDYCQDQQLTLLGDYQEALANEDIDAVVLATPHSQHFEQIVAATLAGKHVFVEKPFTMNQKDAVLAAESARKAGVVLAVGHNRRFLPAIQDLKMMIDNGVLGTVSHIEGNFSGPFALAYNAKMWRANATESPAGGMTAMGIHVVDTFIHLCGPISNVRAQSLGHLLDVEIDDTTSIILNFENGVSGMFSTLCATPRQWRIQVFGTLGWAHLRDHHLLDTCFGDQLHAETKIYSETDIEFAELKAFAEACQNGANYPVTLEEAVHGIAVQDAIIESAQLSGSLKPVSRNANWHPAPRDEDYFATSKDSGRT